MSKRKNISKDAVKVAGFFRLQITEDKAGKQVVVGDSGWRKNQVTNVGFDKFLSRAIAAQSGSLQISHVALGTGGVPNATDTQLTGEIMSSTQRGTVSPSTVASTTQQMTHAFASSDSFLTSASNLSNVGLYNSSATGSLFAGNTYTSSSCATNQNVNVLIKHHLLEIVRSKLRKFGGYLKELFETIPSQALVIGKV